MKTTLHKWVSSKKMLALMLLFNVIGSTIYAQADGDYRNKNNTTGLSITGTTTWEKYSSATGLWTTTTENPTNGTATSTATIREGVTQTSNGTIVFPGKLVIGEGNPAIGTSIIDGTGIVTGVNITSAGKLTVIPAITFVGSATTTATATVSSLKVSGYEVMNPGTGYTTATIKIGNVWAASTAYTVNTQVNSGGNLYTCTTAGTSDVTAGPTGTGTGIIDGAAVWSYAGVAATATATIGTSTATSATGAILSLTITNEGSGYTTMPAITVTGDGTGASVVARIGILAVNITNAGAGYVTAPAIYFGGLFQVGNGTTTRTNTVTGDLEFKAGTSLFTGGVNETLVIGGNLILNSGASVKCFTPQLATNVSTGVTLNKAGTATISGAGTITFRNLTIGASTILAVTAPISIAGTVGLNTTGKIDASNGDITYLTYAQTPIAQTIANGTFLNNTIKNLTINNTSGVTSANVSTAVTGALTLTAGNLAINTSDTITVKAGAIFSGGTSTGFIDTKVDVVTGAKGVFGIEGFSTVRAFPVGTNGNYLPITITPAVSSSFFVTAFNGATVDGTPNGAALAAAQKDTSVDAVYFISKTLPVSPSVYTLKLGYASALKGTTFATYTNQIGISNYNGSVWSAAHGSGDNTANTATDTASTTGAFYVTHNNTPVILPVKFGSISANALSANAVKVGWNVYDEINIDRYTVETSTNGIAFTTVGTVKASGSSSYSLVDNNAAGSVVYYRVKSTDKGTGAVSYSSVVSIALNAAKVASVSVYPNPVVGSQLNLQTANFKAGKLFVLLYDNLGKQIAQEIVTYSGGSMSQALGLAPSIKAGTYQLVVTDGVSSINKAIFIVR